MKESSSDCLLHPLISSQEELISVWPTSPITPLVSTLPKFALSQWNTWPHTQTSQVCAIQGGLCSHEDQHMSSKLPVTTCKGLTDLRSISILWRLKKKKKKTTAKENKIFCFRPMKHFHEYCIFSPIFIFIWPSAVTPSITWVTWRRGRAESSATQSYVVALPRAVPTWDGAEMAFVPSKPMPGASCAREIQISWDENWKLLKIWCAGLQSCSSVNFQSELKLDASGRCKKPLKT